MTGWPSSSPTHSIDRRYKAIVAGAADAGCGHGRRAARALVREPQEDRDRRRDGQARGDALPTLRAACATRRWSNAGWKPAARTRCACTWRRSAIPCWATRSMVEQNRLIGRLLETLGFPPPGACTRRVSGSSIRSQATLWRSKAKCLPTCRNCSIHSAYRCSQCSTSPHCGTRCRSEGRIDHGKPQQRPGDDSCSRRRGEPQPLSGRDQEVPAPDARAGIYARQALSGAWRHRCGGAAGHLAPAPRGEDRDGLSRLWPAVSRADLRRQYRPDAGREEVRARSRLPPRDLCDVVDPRLDPGIHPALVEPGEDGHHRRAEEAVLQPAPDEVEARRVRGWRPAARASSPRSPPISA